VNTVRNSVTNDSSVTSAVLNGTIDPNTFNIYANGSNNSSTNSTTSNNANNNNNNSNSKQQQQQKQAPTTTNAKSSSAPSFPSDDPGIDIDPFFDFGAEFDAARLSKEPFYNSGAGEDDDAGDDDNDDDDEYVEEKKMRRSGSVRGKNAEKGGNGLNATGGVKRGQKIRVTKPARSAPMSIDPSSLLGDDGLSEFGNAEFPDGVVKRKRGRPPGSGRGKKKKVVDPNYE